MNPNIRQFQIVPGLVLTFEIFEQGDVWLGNHRSYWPTNAPEKVIIDQLFPNGYQEWAAEVEQTEELK